MRERLIWKRSLEEEEEDKKPEGCWKAKIDGVLSKEKTKAKTRQKDRT